MPLSPAGSLRQQEIHRQDSEKTSLESLSRERALRELAAVFYSFGDSLDAPAELVALADDSAPEIRGAVIPLVAPLLSNERLLLAAKDEIANIANAAIGELVERRAPQAVELVKAQLAAGRGDALSWAEQLEDPSLMEVAAAFEQGPIEHRIGYLRYVRVIDRDKAVEVLRKLAADENPDNVGYLLSTYASTVGAKAVETLAPLVAEGRAESTRIAALTAIALVRTGEARKIIEKLAKDANEDVRSAAADVIAGWDGEAGLRTLADLEGVPMGLRVAIEIRLYPKDDKLLRDLIANPSALVAGAAIVAACDSGSTEARAAAAERVKSMTLAEIMDLGFQGSAERVVGLKDRAKELAKEVSEDQAPLYDQMLVGLGLQRYFSIQFPAGSAD